MEGLFILAFVGFIIFMAARSYRKQKKIEKELNEKLDIIYSKLPEEDVAVIKMAIKNQRDKETRAQETLRYNQDIIHNPIYSSVAGNIYNHNKKITGGA